MTTVSAPSGMGAPVMILVACPRLRRFVGTAPAGTSSTTLRVVGRSDDAEATSAPITA